MAKNIKSFNPNLLQHLVTAIESVKGKNISVLDFRTIENTAFEYFVICEGTSNIQVRAISESIRRQLSQNLQEKPISMEGIENALWIILDYANIVVHIFQKHIRDHYRLEELWGDAEIQDISLYISSKSTLE